jgi:integrase/recombinase XerC
MSSSQGDDVSPVPIISTTADDEEVLQGFAQYLAEKTSKLSLSSVICYEEDVRGFAAFLRARNLPAAVGLAQACDTDASEYFATLEKSQLKPDTIRRRASALRHFFEFLPRRTRVSSAAPTPSKHSEGLSIGKTHRGRLLALANSDDPIQRAVYDFLADYRISASPHTIKAYTNDLLKFLLFLEAATELNQIDQERTNDFVYQLQHYGLSSNSVARALGTLKSFCAWLKRRRRIFVNPTVGVLISRAKQLPLVPEHEDMPPVTQIQCSPAFPERDRLIWQLLYSCGITTCELVSIDVGYIDWPRKRLLIRGKHRRERYAGLSERCLGALRAYLSARTQLEGHSAGSNSPLIINLRGDRISTRSVARIIKAIAVANGLSSDVHPHTLRHAFRVHNLAQGTGIHAVRHALGVTGHSAVSEWRVR